MEELVFSDSLTRLYCGDCRQMVELADNSVHCVVTSPPYWGLRKYKIQDLVWGGKADCEHEWGNPHMSIVNDSNRANMDWQTGGNPAAKVLSRKISQGQFCLKCNAWQGQLGLEPSPELYVQHIVEVFREVRRVMRPDGILWLNMGDSYAGSGSPGGDFRDGKGGDDYLRPYNRKGSYLKPLDLCQMPFKVADALQRDGWYLRSTIVWNKANPMPESVSSWRWERHRLKVHSRSWRDDGTHIADGHSGDVRNTETQAQWQDCPGCPKCTANDGLVLRKGAWRPTDSHEYIFMLTKTGQYFANQDAVRVASPRSVSPEEYEQAKSNDRNYRAIAGTTWYASVNTIERAQVKSSSSSVAPPGGRNCRTVWSFSTAPYKGAHFATFPEELVKRCLQASTSDAGVCAECEMPWAPVVDRTIAISKECPKTQAAHEARGGIGIPVGTVGKSRSVDGYSKVLGYRPCCQCNGKTIPALVLDPFAGSGTVMQVATQMGLRSIGYELSKEYCTLAIERNRQMGLT